MADVRCTTIADDRTIEETRMTASASPVQRKVSLQVSVGGIPARYNIEDRDPRLSKPIEAPRYPLYIPHTSVVP